MVQTQNLDISLVVENTNSVTSNIGGLVAGLFGSIFDSDYEDEAPLTTSQPETSPPPVEVKIFAISKIIFDVTKNIQIFPVSSCLLN